MRTTEGLSALSRLLDRLSNGRNADIMGTRLSQTLIVEDAICSLAHLSARTDLADLFQVLPDWECALRGGFSVLYDEVQSASYLLGAVLFLAEIALQPFTPLTLEDLEAFDFPLSNSLTLSDALEVLVELHADASTRYAVTQVLANPEPLRMLGYMFKESSFATRFALQSAFRLGQDFDEQIDETPFMLSELCDQLGVPYRGLPFVASGKCMPVLLVGMIGGGLQTR